MLLELAIGDAYGVGFEDTDSQFVASHNNLSRYLEYPGRQLKPGFYSHYTQMSIAIAELLIAQKPWTKQIVANSLISVFERDLKRGCSHNFDNLLVDVENKTELLTQTNQSNHQYNAAVRASPIGILPTIEQVINATTIQAEVTQNTPDGINAAVAVALMSHYFIYDLGLKNNLSTFIDICIAEEWSEPWYGKVKSQVSSNVNSAITAVTRNNNLSHLLQDCINLQGNVSMIAAIALAAASWSYEYEQIFPTVLFNGLENSNYGRDYLIKLDKQLLKLKTD